MGRAKDAIDELLAAAELLRVVDPERLARIVALAKMYAAIYERPDESADVFASRLLEMRLTPKARA